MKNTIRDGISLSYTNGIIKTNKKITEEIVITNKSSTDEIKNFNLGKIIVNDYYFYFPNPIYNICNHPQYNYHAHFYIKDGLLHNDHGPAINISEEQKDYKVDFKIFAKNGVLNSEDCIISESLNNSGDAKQYEFKKVSCLDGKIHSYNGKPAQTYISQTTNNSKSRSSKSVELHYFNNGFFHNLYGPAKSYESYRNYILNGQSKTDTNLILTYYFNNAIHNLKGPAVTEEATIDNTTSKKEIYYIFGKKMSKSVYLDNINKINFKKEFGLA